MSQFRDPCDNAAQGLPRCGECWSCNPVVGHKTWADGSHTPLYKDEADAIWASVEAERLKREADMPTEQDAIRVMFSACQRLKELDWNEAIYCPKDGSTFDAIEAGSTGIHACHYDGEWPNGHWWIAEAGDLYPARPILYRRTEAEKARWAALGARFRDSDGNGEAGETHSGSTEGDSAGRVAASPDQSGAA